MGNTEAKSYKPVSQRDEALAGGDDDLMFVFHSTEGDSQERVVHDGALEEQYGTLFFSIYVDNELIASRNHYDAPVDIPELQQQVHPGDAVEFLTTDGNSHWVLYVGNDFCVHAKNREIRKEDMRKIGDGCLGRIVNQVYIWKPLPAMQIITTAKSQVGKESYLWESSEAFIMWCRTGRSEFLPATKQMVGGYEQQPGNFSLQWYKEGEKPSTRQFHSLPRLIQYRRGLFQDNEL